MLKLNALKNPVGARKKRKIVGRGPGSGHGGTSTRGNKGAKSRSGFKHRFGFEGGQMPVHMRLPKRGFSNVSYGKTTAIVNLKDLEGLEKDAVVDPEFLENNRLVKGRYDFIKVLGEGEIKIPVTVKVHGISEKAKEKILAVGGKVEIINIC